MDLEPNGSPSGETAGRHLWRKNSKSYPMEAGKVHVGGLAEQKALRGGQPGRVLMEEECGLDFDR